VSPFLLCFIIYGDHYAAITVTLPVFGWGVIHLPPHLCAIYFTFYTYHLLTLISATPVMRYWRVWVSFALQLFWICICLRQSTGTFYYSLFHYCSWCASPFNAVLEFSLYRPSPLTRRRMSGISAGLPVNMVLTFR
jgi:uncharacterized CHY-type Zn-finger protein